MSESCTESVGRGNVAADLRQTSTGSKLRCTFSVPANCPEVARRARGRRATQLRGVSAFQVLLANALPTSCPHSLPGSWVRPDRETSPDRPNGLSCSTSAFRCSPLAHTSTPPGALPSELIDCNGLQTYDCPSTSFLALPSPCPLARQSSATIHALGEASCARSARARQRILRSAPPHRARRREVVCSAGRFHLITAFSSENKGRTAVAEVE